MSPTYKKIAPKPKGLDDSHASAWRPVAEEPLLGSTRPQIRQLCSRLSRKAHARDLRGHEKLHPECLRGGGEVSGRQPRSSSSEASLPLCSGRIVGSSPKTGTSWPRPAWAGTGAPLWSHSLHRAVQSKARRNLGK